MYLLIYLFDCLHPPRLLESFGMYLHTTKRSCVARCTPTRLSQCVKPVGFMGQSLAGLSESNSRSMDHNVMHQYDQAFGLQKSVYATTRF